MRLTHSAVACWVRPFAGAEFEGRHGLEGFVLIFPETRLELIHRAWRDALEVWGGSLHGAKGVRRRILAHG